MVGFFREGLWIPLIFLLAAVLYAVWIIYRNLDRLRQRGHTSSTELGGVLLHYQIAMERIERAESWIQSGELKRALEELKAVRDTNVNITTIDLLLGKAYLQMGQKDSARDHLKMFLEKTRPYDQKARSRMDEARDLLERIEAGDSGAGAPP